MIILASEHGMNAPCLLCPSSVDGDDVRVRVPRAHNGRIKLIGQLEIIKKRPCPRNRREFSRRGTDPPIANLVMTFVEPKCDGFCV